MPPPTRTTSGFALSGTALEWERTSASLAVHECARGAAPLIVGRIGSVTCSPTAVRYLGLVIFAMKSGPDRPSRGPQRCRNGDFGTCGSGQGDAVEVAPLPAVAGEPAVLVLRPRLAGHGRSGRGTPRSPRTAGASRRSSPARRARSSARTGRGRASAAGCAGARSRAGTPASPTAKALYRERISCSAVPASAVPSCSRPQHSAKGRPVPHGQRLGRTRPVSPSVLPVPTLGTVAG